MFVKNELGKLTPLSSSNFTRPIRILLGRCYMEIYAKGDRKTLFDVVSELLTALNTGKADRNIDSKFFLVHVIGDIFSVAGDSIMAMAAHGTLSLMRVLRYSSNNAGYRTSIFKSLSQIFSMTGSFVDENLARDVWKQARNGASDKSSLVRVAALDVRWLYALPLEKAWPGQSQAGVGLVDISFDFLPNAVDSGQDLSSCLVGGDVVLDNLINTGIFSME